MARPKANELTERELEVMQVFWDHGQQTASEIQQQLEKQGRKPVSYTHLTLPTKA